MKHSHIGIATPAATFGPVLGFIGPVLLALGAAAVIVVGGLPA